MKHVSTTEERRRLLLAGRISDVMFGGFYICRNCGSAWRDLGQHLSRSHGLTIKQYLATWNLPADTPLSSKKRSAALRESPLKASTRPVTALRLSDHILHLDPPRQVLRLSREDERAIRATLRGEEEESTLTMKHSDFLDRIFEEQTKRVTRRLYWRQRNQRKKLQKLPGKARSELLSTPVSECDVKVSGDCGSASLQPVTIR
jgi:hypothetical protein